MKEKEIMSLKKEYGQEYIGGFERRKGKVKMITNSKSKVNGSLGYSLNVEHLFN